LAFFSHLQLAHHKEHPNLFLNLRKNIIEIPSDYYNPIVPAPGEISPFKIFLIASDACIAAYANTSTKHRCNAEISEVQPVPTHRTGYWMREHPFSSIDQWTAVTTSAILWLRATKDIKKGEEIFAFYPLPDGVQRIKQAPALPGNDYLEGSIALEGDETVTSMSPTISDHSVYSGGELTEDTNTNPNSPQSSPQWQPTAHPDHQIFSPDLDSSEYTISFLIS
jgi:hypothetical protein